MKTTLKFLTYLMMAFALVLTISSCEGEDGVDGEIGPQGEQGIDGQDGEDGQDGNANVTSVTFDQYSLTEGTNEFEIPELTQEIFDHGFVYGYVTVSGNAFWETIPIVINKEVLLDIDRIEVGKITLQATFNQTLNFRFILVEGTDVSGTNFTNYTEVASYYNLRD